MRIIPVILFVLMSFAATAQRQSTATKEDAAGKHKEVQYTMTKDELVAKHKELQDAINETERQLDAVKKDKNATMGQLRALQNKLAQRQNLIANINEEMHDIDNTIQSSSKEVVTLKQKLDQLKIRYAQSIRYAYETRSSYDMIAFLFSSSGFNDAMRRMKYLKKFREFRKQQVDQIYATQNQLQHKIGALKTEKAQKDQLLTSQEQQKQALEKDESLTNQVMEELKGREGELMKDVEKNRKIAARVKKAINEVIEREMAKAMKAADEEEKRKAAELAKANTSKPTKPAAPGTASEPVTATNLPSRTKQPKGEAQPLLLTPTDVALANNFEGNRGKLYWPVDKGIIADHYGTHPHPIEHKVMINNAGIDIQTTPGATVKAVFDGMVSSVNYIDGNPMIIIQHGNYFTVYTNLSSASVAKGQHVNTNQAIGVVANNDQGEPTINFQIWKAGKKGAAATLNPEVWIGKAR